MVIKTLHVQWLGFLNILFRKINNQGWLAIEEEFEQDSSLRELFPLINNGPYFEFVTDIFNLIADGTETDDVRRYAGCAIAGLTKNPPKKFKVSALHCIWNAIDNYLYDLHPDVACEFGRVFIPYSERPKAEELKKWLRQINTPEPVKNIDELYARADLFIETIK